MILYFKTKPNTNGNIKQLEINTGAGSCRCGFFLFSSSVDAVTVTPRQLEEIARQVEKQRPQNTDGGKKQ